MKTRRTMRLTRDGRDVLKSSSNACERQARVGQQFVSRLQLSQVEHYVEWDCGAGCELACDLRVARPGTLAHHR